MPGQRQVKLALTFAQETDRAQYLEGADKG
jgi:hypothetical protein